MYVHGDMGECYNTYCQAKLEHGREEEGFALGFNA